MDNVQRTSTDQASFQNGCWAVLKRLGRAWGLSILFFVIFPATLKAGQFGDFTYVYAYPECTITGYTGAGGDVEIPFSVIDGTTCVTVTGIDAGTFKACTNLTAITIPSGVASIGCEAFYGCFRLTKVIIPARVTDICSDTFKACSNLTSVTISAPQIVSIESGAFSDCVSLSSVFFLGDQPSSVDSNAFSGVTNATFFYQPQKHGWDSTFAGQPTVQLPFKYVVTVDGRASFCGFGSIAVGAVTIPTEAGGYPVTDIGGKAFADCVGLTGVTIPTTITSIGIGAFFGCAGLTQVTIPDSVTNIANYAFADCIGLRSVTMSHSVINIGAGTFSGCLRLTGVTIPAGVASIGDQAFESCSGLKAVTALDGVASVGFEAFSGCSGLSSMMIPSSVTNVGWWAFSDCTRLTEVTIPDSVTSIGDYAFSGCAAITNISVAEANANYSSLDGVLFNSDQTMLIRCPSGKTGNYVIPSGVTAIKTEALSGCASLSSVAIPAGVSSIGGYAFEGCTNLAAINVDVSNASYCSLEGVLFDNSVSTLIQYPIGKADNRYTIPSDVSSVNDGAFEGCAGLTEVSISSNVTSIGNCAFKDCTGLTGIMIPAGVTLIGDQAFLNCTALTAIHVDSANANYSSMDGVLFGYIDWQKKQQTLIQYPAGRSGSYTIPDDIQFIGDYAFFNCTGLTGVTISSSVCEIGDYAFCNCTGLTSITIPDNCDCIGNAAFFNCAHLNNVAIPSSISSIGNAAFLNCSELTEIDVNTNNACFCSANGVLFDKSQTTLIQCPAGKIGSYCVPGSVTRLDDHAFFNCIGLTAIDVDASNEVYSSDNGVLFDKSQTTLIQCPGGKAGGCPVLPSVIGIKSVAFFNCSLLTGIALPVGLTTVGEYAFSKCNSLLAITVDADNPYYSSLNGVLFNKDMSCLIQYPAGRTESSYTVSNTVTCIEGGAFSGVESLLGVYFKGDKPDRVGLGVFSGADNVIVYYMPGTAGWGEPFFAGCPAVFLPYLYAETEDGILLSAYVGTNAVEVIPSSIEGKPVTDIESYAFFNCTNLTSVTIPACVVSIGDSAFENCVSLTSVTVSAGVIDIGDAAFYNCISLSGMSLPDSVTSIGNWAFASCDALREISVPASVIDIGNYAFAYCANLDGIYFKGDAPDFGWTAVAGSKGVTLYYASSAAGWNQPVAGQNPVLWDPHVQAGSEFGPNAAGQFRFTVLGTNNMTVVVEACTNLVNAVWLPVSTVTLADGMAAFTDVASTNHLARYYRFRMPDP